MDITLFFIFTCHRSFICAWWACYDTNHNIWNRARYPQRKVIICHRGISVCNLWGSYINLKVTTSQLAAHPCLAIVASHLTGRLAVLEKAEIVRLDALRALSVPTPYETGHAHGLRFHLLLGSGTVLLLLQGALV